MAKYNRLKSKPLNCGLFFVCYNYLTGAVPRLEWEWSVATKLTLKQEAFCKEYIIDLNATKAAIRAGYSPKTAKDIGCENLAKPYLSAYITDLFDKRSEKLEISADYVLQRLKEIDDLDVLDIMLNDLTGFKKLSEWPKEWRTSLSGVDIMQMGGEDNIEAVIKKIKWPDKVKNLEMIGRHVSVKAWDKEVEKSSDSLADSVNKLIDRMPN